MGSKMGNDVKYDPNNLPQDIVDGIEWSIHYSLGDLRKQLGLPEAELNTNDKDFKLIAKIYKNMTTKVMGILGED